MKEYTNYIHLMCAFFWGFVGGVWFCTFDPMEKQSEVKEKEVYVVTATIYHAVEEQCDDTPLITACGKHINPANPYGHRYLAVSRDLLDVFPYGTEVMVSGTDIYDGKWIVADTMNKRFNGYIDLLINKDMKIGKWNGVKITKVD